jgi:5,10-methenyltetrahydrofolate synthetase
MATGYARKWRRSMTDGRLDNLTVEAAMVDATSAGDTATGPLDIKNWRRQERKRLLAMRRTYAAETRAQATSALEAKLGSVCEGRPGVVLGLYWPIKGEIEVCRWGTRFAATRGMRTALPVVVTKNSPLEYWQWRMGEPLTRGFWNIPVPASRTAVDPAAVIIPLIGFYEQYRLGYGGGYFDRTLAARVPRPVAIGIGFESCRLPEFTALPHDIPMDFIVTDRGVYSS